MNKYPLQLGIALLVAKSVIAQNNADTTTPNDAQTTTAAGNNNNNNQQTTTAAGNNNQQTTTNQPAATTTPAATNAATNGGTTRIITGIGTNTSLGSLSSSTAASTSARGVLTGLPTIAGYGIPSMIVPDTSGAPFMRVSSVPEGTIFIAVGACLAFLGVAILAWRGAVAYSVRQSVKRANEKMAMPEHHKLVKPGIGGAASFGNGSSLSMDHLSNPNGNHTRKNLNATPRSNIASYSNAARGSSLFFSPTSGNNNGSHSSIYLPNNRSSSFLPSGFYAPPGANSPSGGVQSSQIGSAPPNRLRQSRYQDQTPPDSPGLPPHNLQVNENRGRQSNSMYQASTSSLNLNTPSNAHPGGRAPSANLDNMLGDYPLPNAR